MSELQNRVKQVLQRHDWDEGEHDPGVTFISECDACIEELTKLLEAARDEE